MKKKYIGFVVIVLIAASIACNLNQTSGESFAGYGGGDLGDNSPIAVEVTATLIPTNDQPLPTSTDIPTLIPDSTDIPLPTATTVPPTPAGDPAWTTGWNIPYQDQGEWYGGKTFTGPAVVEWWDQQADGYDHEGFVVLQEGESVTFPTSQNGIAYIGRWWKLASHTDAVRLIQTYRHLVFYANQFGSSYWISVFGQETYTRFLGNQILLAKPQHSYMSEYNCNFSNQSECHLLDPLVRHLPDGIEIENDN